MMKKKIIILFLLTFAMLFCGCSKEEEGKQEEQKENVSSETAAVDMFTDRDYEMGYDESNSVVIELNGDSASCSSNAVQISGSTITIMDEGTYILRGILNDGMIIVNAEDTDKPQIVLDNVSICSETSASIYILEADKVFLTLAEGTENTLSNGGSFETIDDNNIDAVIFSKQDLTLNGYGGLKVISPTGHGIVSKDDLVFTSGSYTIEAALHGIDANDSVRIANAEITIDSGKDGLHAENSEDTSLGFIYVAGAMLDMEAEGDGISASAYVKIEDGTFAIIAGGGSVNAQQQTSDSWGGFRGERPGHTTFGTSASTTEKEDSDDSSTSIKGIKASGDVTIQGGIFSIDSADDAIHSNASVTVNGGTFEIASGDDGIHADETLTITSGTINISESYEGLEGLHVVVSGGDITLEASDDGINAAGGKDSSGFGGPRGNEQFGGSSSSDGSIMILDGNLSITASGDGIDANGTLEISGGHTVVSGPTQGDTATLDYDSSGVITGGTFIGTGASGMAQTFSDSEQGVISVSVGNQQAETEIILEDSDGNTIITHTPSLSYGVVILSSPDIVKGENYTIYVGTASGEFTAS